MKKTTFLAAGLVLAALALSGCSATVEVPSDVNIQVPADVNVQVPTELPGVTVNPATLPPGDTTAAPGTTVVVPVTGQQPGGTNTIVFWGVGGLVGLLILIGLIALLTRPTVVEVPPTGGEVIERERTVERRDDLP